MLLTHKRRIEALEAKHGAAKASEILKAQGFNGGNAHPPKELEGILAKAESGSSGSIATTTQISAPVGANPTNQTAALSPRQRLASNINHQLSTRRDGPK